MSVGSAIAGVEGGCAQRRLNDTAELAPDLLAYHQGVQQPFVALTARAAATLCLVQYATVALAKWDESNSYFRVVRGQMTQVMPLAAPPWDFGSWSVQFYGRQQISPLMSDGFPQPVAPQEGHNHACPMAGKGFHSTQAIVSAITPKPDHVRMRSPRAPLPASDICFSDDRLFVRPSLQRVEESISHCLSASRAMACIPNMLKIEFYGFYTADGEVTASPQTVGLTGKPADVRSPEIVGIPILHHVPPAKRFGKLISKTKRVAEALQTDDPPPPVLLLFSDPCTLPLHSLLPLSGSPLSGALRGAGSSRQQRVPRSSRRPQVDASRLLVRNPRHRGPGRPAPELAQRRPPGIVLRPSCSVP